MWDDVFVAEKTKSPVDETEEQKDAWDYLLFWNELDGIYKLLVKILTYHLEYFDFTLLIIILFVGWSR